MASPSSPNLMSISTTQPSNSTSSSATASTNRHLTSNTSATSDSNSVVSESSTTATSSAAESSSSTTLAESSATASSPNLITLSPTQPSRSANTFATASTNRHVTSNPSATSDSNSVASVSNTTATSSAAESFSSTTLAESSATASSPNLITLSPTQPSRSTCTSATASTKVTAPLFELSPEDLNQALDEFKQGCIDPREVGDYPGLKAALAKYAEGTEHTDPTQDDEVSVRMPDDDQSTTSIPVLTAKSKPLATAELDVLFGPIVTKTDKGSNALSSNVINTSDPMPHDRRRLDTRLNTLEVHQKHTIEKLSTIEQKLATLDVVLEDVQEDVVVHSETVARGFNNLSVHLQAAANAAQSASKEAQRVRCVCWPERKRHISQRHDRKFGEQRSCIDCSNLWGVIGRRKIPTVLTEKDTKIVKLWQQEASESHDG